ncbi:MAG: hypothetical protein EOP04_08620 [Proteobacteria bacterium]|nr:MAG: hypothetical protein EOP04_08620 [Pseudomonadota bacterium]
MRSIFILIGLMFETLSFAGGSSSGGINPPIATFRDETSLSETTEIAIASDEVFKNVLSNAMTSSNVNLKVGESFIKARPTQFNFIDSTLILENPITGEDITVRRPPLGLVRPPVLTTP